jgi:membrane peptidoglycan carboxypeptidase
MRCTETVGFDKRNRGPSESTTELGVYWLYLRKIRFPHRKDIVGIMAVVLTFAFFLLYLGDRQLMSNYKKLESVATEDRTGAVLILERNSKGAFAQYEGSVPPRIKELLLRKEDRFFYFHPGINPLSVVRVLAQYVTGNPTSGASTITEQLVKNLLGHERNRSLMNKLVEALYAVDLELFTSKETILNMYANTVYVGNQVQGLSAASELYFNTKLENLDDTKIAMLLATLSSPSTQNPWKAANATASRNLAQRIGVTFDPSQAVVTRPHSYVPPQNIELASLHAPCTTTCRTTLDADLTERLRTMLNTHVLAGWDAGARSGAIVVIKLPENELLSIVGTPDADSNLPGQQINMALEPRPIGSTAKPFIYLEGFSKGLRPYTLVDDREYKFAIGSGFPLYPKNYDGTYQGWITLHTALSNSLNVPTVKTLQYIGLQNFYDFLEHTLGFEPLQDLDTYQYGIALGALEMDPLSLAHYLTLFPENGVLKPLRLFLDGTTSPMIATPMTPLSVERKVAEPMFAQLVSKVLNDRLTGVPQFGLNSSLNLSQSNYAVKTGTSRDFHDSWTVGYTPDFLVAVWYGNPENTALKHVTGQSGAGSIWHDAMEMLMNSSYNKNTPLDFSGVQDIALNGSIDFGLPGDVASEHRNLLPDSALITTPQDGDTFLLEAQTRIPLMSPENVSWYADGEFLGVGKNVTFSPANPQDYSLKAASADGDAEKILIHVVAH